MLESVSAAYALVLILLGVLLVFLWRGLYPNPYPGIPYNKESAGRIGGDTSAIVALIKELNEFCEAMFTVSTRKLGTPIAQVLFPSMLRKPLVMLEDPREIEDIILRRNKEFDKAPTNIDHFRPMFPNGSITHYTTPQLKAQKRLWADIMSVTFLRKTAAPKIHKAVLELVDLWRLRAGTVSKDRPFSVVGDFENLALDAMWVSLMGEEPGITRNETRKIRDQLAGITHKEEARPAADIFRDEVNYISSAIHTGSQFPLPWFRMYLETFTARYRQHRRTVETEIGNVMKKAVERFQHLGAAGLEAGDMDTCALDLVLRRQLLNAKKAGKAPTDPTKDQAIVDELLVMITGGYDSTATALSWFVKLMEAFPAVQTELRGVLKAAFPGPEPPSVAEILESDIPYLDGACEDVVRLAGTSKGNLRQAVVDTEILGCPIPKGTEILFNYHINRTPAPADEATRSATSRDAAIKRGDGFQGAAGRDLDRLNPRRWLVRDDKTHKEVFNSNALPSLAFGGGFRGCFGRKLAVMEFRIIAVLLILNFEFLELPNELENMTCVEKIFRIPDMAYAKIRAL
ncbi:cytochrome P450 [Lasiosphaeria ovina]|uniref:Cytochrome P450 n=1 Tax=Lasiosphaeria ovina TaxID=92902 RepID=A0AAE0MYK0_9PEZI|nr:cytochrome P450 [Lasiosphaeria ovina]